MNGPQDPDASVGGIEAKGFSEYAALYDKYCCFGSRIRIRFYNWTSSYAAECVLVAMSNDNAIASFNAALAQPTCSKRIILGVPTGSKNQGTLRRYSNVSAIFGIPKSRVRNDDIFSASTTTTPNRQAYWHVWVRNLDQATAINVQMNVDIVYYCRFFDRKEQSALT
jgi:hypothetical protein